MRRYDSLILMREQILAIAAQYGARNVRIFGSVVRGDDGPDSDVICWWSLSRDVVCSTTPL